MLKITEVLPNPEGKDPNNEFAEITNFSDSQINLKNFSIDDSEKGSKPYTFTQDIILQPNESKAFYNSQTKIALNNTTDSARLFDPSGKLIDEIKYDKTTEEKSQSLVEIKSANSSKNIIIETDPSPNRPNKILYKLDGIIIESNASEFTLSEKYSKQLLKITHASEIKELSAITFAPSTEISILASKRSPSTFDLLDYQIIKTASQTKSTSNTQNNTSPRQNSTSLFQDLPLPAIIFPIIIFLIILTLLIKRNKISSCKQL